MFVKLVKAYIFHTWRIMEWNHVDDDDGDDDENDDGLAHSWLGFGMDMCGRKDGDRERGRERERWYNGVENLQIQLEFRYLSRIS